MSAELLNKDDQALLSGLITHSELTDLKMSRFNTKMSFLVPLPRFHLYLIRINKSKWL